MNKTGAGGHGVGGWGQQCNHAPGPRASPRDTILVITIASECVARCVPIVTLAWEWFSGTMMNTRFNRAPPA